MENGESKGREDGQWNGKLGLSGRVITMFLDVIHRFGSFGLEV